MDNKKQKIRKRDKAKSALKAIRDLLPRGNSRISVISLLSLGLLFTPKTCFAFDLDAAFQFGKNGTTIMAEY
jgi:hypothetical protein